MANGTNGGGGTLTDLMNGNNSNTNTNNTTNTTNTNNSGTNDTSTPTGTGTPTTTTTTPTTSGQPTTIVPGEAQEGTGQVNVADYASQAVTDPSQAFTDDMLLSQNTPQMTGNEEGTNINNPELTNGTADQYNAATSTGTASTANQVDPRDATGYEAQTTQENVEQNGQMNAAQGQINQNDLVNADDAQIDMQGSATGTNADGSTNYTGQALNDYAHQDISQIVDTSTPAGQALAQQLGDGNYIDSKATLQGQLQALQSQFVDSAGNPTIPGWAAATARSVSKIASFSGMTGTAATAAMSQALMEASIPIAQQDAQFFQTLTMQNLSNKQEATINKANVLAKFDLTNVDNRMAAAVQNAQSFLQMDMANLDNEQQAQVINTQARVQSILEDAKAVNAQRLFTAQSQNDMDMFYDNLNSSIQQFNAAQQNGMEQFNVDQENSQNRFNSDLENNRDQFYKNMQYNIDVANAKWRQTVTETNNANNFEAAATDVKNMVGLSQEQLNQLWDRSDALLDYVWKSSENAQDRASALAIAKYQTNAALKAKDNAGIGSILGSVAGSLFAPGGVGSDLLGSLFG